MKRFQFTKKGDCPRCGGSGRISRFEHIANGFCFACDGSGGNRPTVGYSVFLSDHHPQMPLEAVFLGVVAKACRGKWIAWSGLSSADLERVGEFETRKNAAKGLLVAFDTNT